MTNVDWDTINKVKDDNIRYNQAVKMAFETAMSEFQNNVEEYDKIKDVDKEIMKRFEDLLPIFYNKIKDLQDKVINDKPPLPLQPTHKPKVNKYVQREIDKFKEDKLE